MHDGILMRDQTQSLVSHKTARRRMDVTLVGMRNPKIRLSLPVSHITAHRRMDGALVGESECTKRNKKTRLSAMEG